MTCALVSCSSKPVELLPTFYSVEERLNASQYAIQDAYLLEVLVDECRKSDGQIKQFAEQADSIWRERNGELLRAAQYEFDRQVIESQKEKGWIVGQLPALYYQFSVGKKARTFLVDFSERSTLKKQNCQFYLAPYFDGQKNLAEVSSVLQQIKEGLPASLQKWSPHKTATDLIEWPQPQWLVNGFEIGDVEGQSLYHVQKMVRTSHCQNATVLSVVNEWPKELYAVYCKARLPIAIQCEWGKCKALVQEG